MRYASAPLLLFALATAAASAQLNTISIPATSALIDSSANLNSILTAPTSTTNALWQNTTGEVTLAGVQGARGISGNGRMIVIQDPSQGPRLWVSGSGIVNLATPAGGSNPIVYDVEEVSGGNARVCGRVDFTGQTPNTRGVIWTFRPATPADASFEEFLINSAVSGNPVRTRVVSISRTGQQVGMDTVGFGETWRWLDKDHGFDASYTGANNTAGLIAVSGNGNAALVRDGSTSVGVNAKLLRHNGNFDAVSEVSFGNFCLPEALSADGQVVIGTSFAGPGLTGTATAFIWTPSLGARSLLSVLSDNGVNTSGWALQTAELISDDGQRVIGKGTFNGDPVTYQAVIFGICGQTDCNANNRGDRCDIALGSSRDCNFNGVPDECEALSPQTTNYDNGLAFPWRTSGACRKVNGAILLTEGTSPTIGTLTREPTQRRLLRYMRISFDFRMTGSNVAKGIGVYAYDASRYPIDALFNDDGPGTGSIGVKIDPFDGVQGQFNVISVRRNGGELIRTTAPFNVADNVRRRAELVISPDVLVFRVEVNPGDWRDIVTLATSTIPAGMIPRFGIGSQRSGSSFAHEVDNVTLYIPDSDDINLDTLLDDCGGCDLGLPPKLQDCNGNKRPDICDFDLGYSSDCNTDESLDECVVFAPQTESFDSGPGAWQVNGTAAAGGGTCTFGASGNIGDLGTIVRPPANSNSRTKFARAEMRFRFLGDLGGEGLGLYFFDSFRYGQNTLFDDDGPGLGSVGIKVRPVNTSFSSVSLIHDGVSLGERYFANNILDNAPRTARLIITGRTAYVEIISGTTTIPLFVNSVLPTSMSPDPQLPRFRVGIGARKSAGAATLEDATFFAASAADANANGILDSCEAAPTPGDGGLPCDDTDFDNDGLPGTIDDIAAFINALSGLSCEGCDQTDFNRDGVLPDNADLEAFIRVIAGGAC